MWRERGKRASPPPVYGGRLPERRSGCEMELEFEDLTPENVPALYEIERGVPEGFVLTSEELIEVNRYGFEHNCTGHTFLIRLGGRCIGAILIGEALPWPTDPPEVAREPFYRLMSFIIDRRLRGRGIGGEALEQAIERVFRDFGVRPLVLGCHRDNVRAARFYKRHGFTPTAYAEGDDIYYLRYPEYGSGAVL